MSDARQVPRRRGATVAAGSSGCSWGRVDFHTRCQEKVTATTPQASPPVPSPGPEGSQPPGPFPVRLLQLFPHGASSPCRVLLRRDGTLSARRCLPAPRARSGQQRAAPSVLWRVGPLRRCYRKCGIEASQSDPGRAQLGHRPPPLQGRCGPTAFS